MYKSTLSTSDKLCQAASIRGGDKSKAEACITREGGGMRGGGGKGVGMCSYALEIARAIYFHVNNRNSAM